LRANAPNSGPFVLYGAWGLGQSGKNNACPSVSVPTNIVEGCARAGQAEYLRFLDIAFASCRELLYLIDLSCRLGLLDDLTRKEIAKVGDQVAGKLTGLRNSLGT